MKHSLAETAPISRTILKQTATDCNTLQHAATHSNTLQRTFASRGSNIEHELEQNG